MKNLFKALAQFQQEVPVIFKGSTAGQGNFAYQYTDLPAIFKVINPLLAKHGLGFSQITEFKDGHDYLVTIVFHIESGETLETRTRLMPDVELRGQNVFQSYGSQLTYFRRYGISQILGLVTDKDTDAQGEQVKKKPTITVERFEKALQAIQEGKAKVSDLDKFELSDVQQSALKLL
jgi:hypothetical protein